MGRQHRGAPVFRIGRPYPKTGGVSFYLTIDGRQLKERMCVLHNHFETWVAFLLARKAGGYPIGFLCTYCTVQTAPVPGSAYLIDANWPGLRSHKTMSFRVGRADLIAQFETCVACCPEPPALGVLWCAFATVTHTRLEEDQMEAEAEEILGRAPEHLRTDALWWDAAAEVAIRWDSAEVEARLEGIALRKLLRTLTLPADLVDLLAFCAGSPSSPKRTAAYADDLGRTRWQYPPNSRDPIEMHTYPGRDCTLKTHAEEVALFEQRPLPTLEVQRD